VKANEPGRRAGVRLIGLHLLAALAAIALSACGGGGGGGDVAPPPPPPGGSGTGADGVPIFWYPYDTSVAVGAISSMQQTADGGFVGVGYQMNDFSSRQDAYVLKVDSRGTRQWQRRLALGTNAWAHGVRQTADSGFIVVGTVTVAAGNTDVFLLRLDASGNTAAGWPKMYGGAGPDEGFAVLPVNGGADGYVVAGRYESAGNPSVYVLRTDANGAVTWHRFDYAHYCPNSGEEAKAIVATDDGNLAVAGVTGCFGVSGILIKVNAADGAEMWRRGYDTTATVSTRLESLAATPDGGFVLAGSTASVFFSPPVVGKADALVIRTDAGGTESWRRTYGGTESDWAGAAAVTADGGILMAGVSRSFGGLIQDPAQAWQWENVLLARLDSNGNTLWQKIKGNRLPSSDGAGAVAAAADGGFAVGGSADGNVMLAKFDKNGDTVNLGATDLTYTVPPTTGVVTLANAVEVTAAGVRGLTGPRQVGGTTLDLLIDAASGVPASDYCNVSGTYTFAPAPTAPAAGSVYTLTLDNCVTGPAGDQTRLNGLATIAIDSLSGTFSSGSYTVQTTLTGVNLLVADVGATGTIQIAGGLRYLRSAAAGAYSEVSGSISTPAAQTLTFAESGGTTNRTVVIGPFSVRSSVQAGGAVSLGATIDTLTVTWNGYPLAVAVMQPLVASGSDEAPASGGFQVTATDNSRVTTTVTNGTASLAVDTNGDGTVDGTLTVPWESID
jgi:hypothetical protein